MRISVERKQAGQSHLGKTPPGQAPYSSTVNQLSRGKHRTQAWREGAGPCARGCQQEARGKEAAEPRAEDQAGGAAVLLQLKKKKLKKGRGGRKKEKKPWWFLALNPNLHLIWESFA